LILLSLFVHFFPSFQPNHPAATFPHCSFFSVCDFGNQFFGQRNVPFPKQSRVFDKMSPKFDMPAYGFPSPVPLFLFILARIFIDEPKTITEVTLRPLLSADPDFSLTRP